MNFFVDSNTDGLVPFVKYFYIFQVKFFVTSDSKNKFLKFYVTGSRNKSLQTKMADFGDFRPLQYQQCHAMDSVQYYCNDSSKLLQCFHIRNRYDEHDLHDNVYPIHFSSQLSSGQICKLNN